MPERQRTLSNIARLSGPGAFTGDNITVEIHPAPVNHGPSFELVRSGTIYPIHVGTDNIIETENRTVLWDMSDKSRQINIVEHILSALYGLGVDNAIIRVDSTEMPLMDGSALPYVQALDEAGYIEQDGFRREIVIEKPMFIDDNALILVLPHDGMRITYYLDHPHDIVSKRLAQIDVTPESFRKQIAPARTFITEDKAAEIVSGNSVRHKDLSQVLVVGKTSTSQPLRIEDEFVYHKMLDILGDFYLTGRMIRGHIIGIRSGHYQNRRMIRKISELYL